MSQLHVINHPMIQHKLTIMRKKETGSKDFRQLLNEISLLMGYEVTRDIPLEPVEIETPIIPTEACGEKDVYFQINTSDLGGADLVIFESKQY